MGNHSRVMMQKRLFWVGVGLAALAAVFSLVALDTNAAGLSEVNPLAALGLALAGFVLVFASKNVPK